MDFKPETKTCKDVEIRGVAWGQVKGGQHLSGRICVVEGPCILFGSQRLDIQEHVRSEEISSDERGIDTSKTRKAQEGSTSTTQT